MQSLLRDQDTLERGIEQGIEQGRFEEKIEMAKNMLLDDVPLETISKYTSLSIAELEELRDK